VFFRWALPLVKGNDGDVIGLTGTFDPAFTRLMTVRRFSRCGVRYQLAAACCGSAAAAVAADDDDDDPDHHPGGGTRRKHVGGSWVPTSLLNQSVNQTQTR
jgi:hypothetical protein